VKIKNARDRAVPRRDFRRSYSLALGAIVLNADFSRHFTRTQIACRYGMFDPALLGAEGALAEENGFQSSNA
jgi:hypothetical protein